MKESIVRLSPVAGKERRARLTLKGAYLDIAVEEQQSNGYWSLATANAIVSIPVDSSVDVASVAGKLVILWEARRDEEIAERVAKAKAEEEARAKAAMGR